MLDWSEDDDTFEQNLEGLRKDLAAGKLEHALSHAAARVLSEVLMIIQPESEEEAKVRKDYFSAYRPYLP